MSKGPYEVAHLDELDRIPVGDSGLFWRPVRRRLGIEAFGVNAYSADSGDEVVEHHDETGPGAGKHEELYFVVRGRARFTLDGDDIDAPAGTFVFVRDPAVTRCAISEDPDTTVLALGGKPGVPYRVSPWEYYFAAIPAYRAKDYELATEIVLPGLDQYPGHPVILFTLACHASLAGNRELALEHLAAAVENDPRARNWARDDTDFAPIRTDPEFLAITGQANTAGEAP